MQVITKARPLLLPSQQAGIRPSAVFTYMYASGGPRGLGSKLLYCTIRDPHFHVSQCQPVHVHVHVQVLPLRALEAGPASRCDIPPANTPRCTCTCTCTCLVLSPKHALDRNDRNIPKLLLHRVGRPVLTSTGNASEVSPEIICNGDCCVHVLVLTSSPAPAAPPAAPVVTTFGSPTERLWAVDLVSPE